MYNQHNMELQVLDYEESLRGKKMQITELAVFVNALEELGVS